MSGQYDDKCKRCDNGLVTHGEEEETCNVCDGYGYLLTPKGLDLIEFLKRRGLAFPMSPIAEEELQGTIE